VKAAAWHLNGVCAAARRHRDCNNAARSSASIVAASRRVAISKAPLTRPYYERRNSVPSRIETGMAAAMAGIRRRGMASMLKHGGMTKANIKITRGSLDAAYRHQRRRQKKMCSMTEMTVSGASGGAYIMAAAARGAAATRHICVWHHKQQRAAKRWRMCNQAASRQA